MSLVIIGLNIGETDKVFFFTLMYINDDDDDDDDDV